MNRSICSRSEPDEDKYTKWFVQLATIVIVVSLYVVYNTIVANATPDSVHERLINVSGYDYWEVTEDYQLTAVMTVEELSKVLYNLNSAYSLKVFAMCDVSGDTPVAYAPTLSYSKSQIDAAINTVRNLTDRYLLAIVGMVYGDFEMHMIASGDDSYVVSIQLNT